MREIGGLDLCVGIIVDLQLNARTITRDDRESDTYT